MTQQPVVCIVTAAKKDDANLTWAAWGKGPDTFSRKLTTANPALFDSPITNYLMADSSTSVEDVQVIQGFANGDLPPIEGSWGHDGVIEAADAQAAVSGANLQCYSASGNVTPQDHVDAILLSRDLRYVPAED